jgi:hypothetical protein
LPLAFGQVLSREVATMVLRLLLFALVAGAGLATAPVGIAAEGSPKFVGVSKCKSCHNKKEKGAQYDVWKTGPHARAWETLASPAALALAEELELGVTPQESPACLECHVTGHGAPEKLTGKLKEKNGVGCESCHGAGGDYYRKTEMTAIFRGELMPETVGLVFPNESVCRGCHNERSPTWAGFDFDEAVAKIAHPHPAVLEDDRRTRALEDERSLDGERP